MNKRFGFIKDWTNPEWKESNFNKKFPKKSQKIFIASMSEIRFWKMDWILKTFKRIKGYPQHIFQFLTKYPHIYNRLEFPAKAWLGFTITENKDLANGISHIKKLRDLSLTGKYLYFTSIEPILEKINPLDLIFIDWVIVGAETGQRSGKVTPKKEWIKSLVDYCRDNDIPIYLKNSLRGIYPEEIKEFPGTKAELKLF
ncbi:unnamed protein product [marine sediment metagenome]|uniref:DUF5131 family protein n=1 Tax=marine sediment metagenome TaxID=412755 RepID=X1MZY2_9ZZZZ